MDAAQLASGELAGTLNVGAIPTVAPYILGDFVPEAVELHPHATLRFEELQTRDLLAALREGQIDLGLCALPVDGKDLTAFPLIDDDFVLALSSHHPLADSTDDVTTGVLARENVLLLAEGHCLRDQALAICSLVHADPTDLHATSLHTLVQMVAAGVGVTLLPETAISVEARAGNGIVVREFLDAPSRTLALVWRSSSPRSVHYQQLAEHFAGRLREKQRSITYH